MCLAKKAAREMLLREWGVVVRELEASGVILYTLKGPALSQQLYGDPTAREYRDLDFFVDGEERNIHALSTLFHRLGYETEINRRTAFVEPSHLTAWKIGLPVYMEMHGRKEIGLRRYYTLRMDSLVERSVELRYLNGTYRTFSLDDHGLYFLAHGTRHGWPVLSWLADAAVFFHRSLDWERFWRSCRGTGMARIALSSLHTAKRLFQVPTTAPDALQRSRDTVRARQASAIIYTYLIDKVPPSRKRYWMLRKTLFSASRMHRSLFFKYTALRPLFSPRMSDAQSMRLRDPLAFLLWFLRPLLVLFRVFRGKYSHKMAG
jgi:hypothetical protein